jgi:hypothetical protein
MTARKGMFPSAQCLKLDWKRLVTFLITSDKIFASVGWKQALKWNFFVSYCSYRSVDSPVNLIFFHETNEFRNNMKTSVKWMLDLGFSQTTLILYTLLHSTEIFNISKCVWAMWGGILNPDCCDFLWSTQ